MHLFFCTQNSHEGLQNTSDIVCVKSVAYDAVPHKPPVYDYVLVNGILPKLSSEGPHYMEVGPRPSEVSTVLPGLEGKKVLDSNVWKQTVSHYLPPAVALIQQS